MIIEQKSWTKDGGWVTLTSNPLTSVPQLVLAFAGRRVLEDKGRFDELKSFYPNSNILQCSTAGEILDTKVYDDSIALTAIHFEKTRLEFAQTNINNSDESESVGVKLANLLPKEGLVHVMVFSDGLHVNGTALVSGINKTIPSNISVTGGLVGDGDVFKTTLIGLNEPASENKVAIIGFYGNDLKVGYGSLGGWDAFGIDRKITKSKNNILYELDETPALDIYEEYLGELSEGLPSTGLLFPLRLSMPGDNGEYEVVRTLLSVDKAQRSMTFAGDMPEGVYARLMKANFERLVEGASGAGTMSIKQLGGKSAELAILISCVGRKLVLRERIEEETEAVRKTVGRETAMTGFYSYGELCPLTDSSKKCQLNNQTMTITTFSEK